VFDSICFLIEAAIFFYMSRALSPVHWISFYIAVVVLLWFDTVWGIVTSQLHSNPPPVSWLILNLVWGGLAGVLIASRKRLSNETAVWVGSIGLLIRTVLDYALNWSRFYFP
jgi:RsiW-degrading membrane proteinase PrsW (M82 family)